MWLLVSLFVLAVADTAGDTMHREGVQPPDPIWKSINAPYRPWEMIPLTRWAQDMIGLRPVEPGFQDRLDQYCEEADSDEARSA